MERDEANQEYVNQRSEGGGSLPLHMPLHCKVMILMGKTNPAAKPHQTTSQILVPMDKPVVTLLRAMTAIGDEETLFTNVCVPFSNMLLGDGRGFEIIQARLGPGHIHHCMRCIG